MTEIQEGAIGSESAIFPEVEVTFDHKQVLTMARFLNAVVSFGISSGERKESRNPGEKEDAIEEYQRVFMIESMKPEKVSQVKISKNSVDEMSSQLIKLKAGQRLTEEQEKEYLIFFADLSKRVIAAEEEIVKKAKENALYYSGGWTVRKSLELKKKKGIPYE